MATVKSLEELDVWKLARQLSKGIYKLTSTDPFIKDYRLCNQMRGSSGSIMDNIAEGFERNGRNEFINCLSIAKGECGELKSQLYRARDIDYLAQEEFRQFHFQIDKLTRKLASLIQYLNTTDIRGLKFKGRTP